MLMTYESCKPLCSYASFSYILIIIELGKPVYENAVWKDETITFNWKGVSGAEGYKLVLKSRNNKELLTQKMKKCCHQMQMTNDICIGRECLVKIYAEIGKKSSESDQNIQQIGGKI